MTEAGKAGAAHPPYLAKAFAVPESAQEWLNLVAADGYRFLSMASMEGTNHFSKELEGLIWIVVERKEAPTA